jgi:hypothetical protein
VAGLLVAIVLLQRLAVPAGGLEIPAVVPLGLALVGVLVLRGELRPVPLRVLLFAVATATLAAAGYLASRAGGEVHATALLIVLAVFAPLVLRAPRDAAAATEGCAATGRVFVRLMSVLALVGAAQVGAQLLGVWTYADVIARTVPSQLLVGGYNTSIPLQWGSSLYKAQAFVFVEPSTFSQFTALAIVVALLVRAPLWQVVALSLGLVSAVSGTGLVLLVAGLVLLLLRSPRVIRPAHVAAALLALAAAVSTPAGDIFLTRSNEAHSQTSSLALRFVRPYDEVAVGLADEPQRWVWGEGPGSSDRVLESGRERAGLYVVYTMPAKLLFEYGLAAAVVFVAFVLTVMLRGSPSLVLSGTVLVWLTLLGGYLAAAPTVWAAWLLTAVWSRRE